MQLMELAIMNGTYREALAPHAGATFVINTPRMYDHIGLSAGCSS